MRYLYRVLVAFLGVVLLLLFSGKLLLYLQSEPIRQKPHIFEFFDNEVGHTSALIPNFVHYVVFGNGSLTFVNFLSIVSAIKVQQPNEIWIHSDSTLKKSRYWDLLQQLSIMNAVPLRWKFLAKPTHVFGQPLSSIYHATDIGRIQVLMEYGGIYLDTDTLILKPLDKFFHYEMVVGWPKKDLFGTQILLAHKEARFLGLWLNGYRRYRSRQWYYNAGQYPTEQILAKWPGLVHRVERLFGVNNLLEELYGEVLWAGWKELYAIHLLSRHPPAPTLSETSVLHYNRTFGEIARWILFETMPCLNISSPSPHWSLFS